MRKVFSVISFLLIFPFSFLLGQNGSYQNVEKKFQAASGRSLEVMLNVDAAEVIIEKNPDPYLGAVFMGYTRGEFRSKIDFNQRKNRIKISLQKNNWFEFKRDHSRRNHTRAEVKVRRQEMITWEKTADRT